MVIPTHDRCAALARVLGALERQRDAPPFEVIVVDDGSSDGTREWLARATFGIPVQSASQPNHGPASARNRGIERATGRIVAFLGDDTEPDPDWVAAHAAAGRRGFELIGYRNCPEVYVGCGFAAWRVDAG